MSEFDSETRASEGERIEAVVNDEFNSVESLGIDPGKSNGICGYDEKHYLLFMKTLQENEVIEFLNRFHKLKRIVCESYKLFPGPKSKAQAYSDMIAPRVIGRIEAYCAARSIELIMQPSNIKVTGYAWIGQKPPPKSNPKNHQMDAHVHFMYWAITSGAIKLEDILKKQNIK